MTVPTAPDAQGSSTRPYLIRALHDWCTDNGYTPYIAVYVDRSVQVPMEYVKNNEIVLNVGFEATSGLKLGNELIEFKARFGGSAREILVPIDHVVAIYARENGQGMAFPAPTETAADPAGGEVPAPAPAELRPGGVRSGLRLAASEGAPPAAAEGKADNRPDAKGPTVVEPPADDGEPEPPSPGGGRPSLKRIK